jgi:4-hydroxybenzoate polyprenyltransferase
MYFPLLKALKFMISSSLLLALNGAMVVVFGFILYGSRIMPELLFAAFLVTFGVYGLNKVTDRAEDAINRPDSLPKASSHYAILSIASMLSGFLIGLLEGIPSFIVLLAPVLIGVVYSVRISKSIPRLKEIVGVKSLVVAISWAFTGCLLPDSIHAAQFEATVIVFAYIFIRVFIGTILFDVLDTKGDSAIGTETVPIRLGRNKTKKLLLLLNTAGLVLVIYCITEGFFVQFIPTLLFGVLYGYFAIWFFLRTNCKRFAAALLLDAEWLPMLIIASLLIT